MAQLTAWRAHRTMDVEHRQALIDFFDDPHYVWHHRLLLVKGEPSVWVGASPTHGVMVLKLSEHRVIPLAKNAAFPDDCQDMVFMFDPIDAAALNSLVDRAEALATIMGFAQPHVDGGGEGPWYVLDTAHASCGNLFRRRPWGWLLRSAEVRPGLFRSTTSG